MSDTDEKKPPTFLRVREVAEFVGLKPAAIDRMIRAGTFPRPFLIGMKAKGWDREEIMKWKEQRSAARDSYADPARPTTADIEKLTA